MPGGLNLRGQLFGKLKPLKFEIHKGRRAWLCECLCGNVHWALGRDLRSGDVKSCGCARVDAERERGGFYRQSRGPESIDDALDELGANGVLA